MKSLGAPQEITATTSDSCKDSVYVSTEMKTYINNHVNYFFILPPCRVVIVISVSVFSFVLLNFPVTNDIFTGARYRYTRSWNWILD